MVGQDTPQEAMDREVESTQDPHRGVSREAWDPPKPAAKRWSRRGSWMLKRILGCLVDDSDEVSLQAIRS